MSRLILVLALIGAELCFPAHQFTNSNIPSESVSDEAYVAELSRLVNELQKNPWERWPAGTKVVLRYFVERDSKGLALGHEQPDIVMSVVEQGRSFRLMQLVKGKTVNRDFLIKDQPGLEAALPTISGESPTPTSLKIDGVTVASLMRESTLQEWLGRVTSTLTTRQWVIANHPTAVIRRETVGSNSWEVTSAQITKRIGERDFQCVEITEWLRFYHKGPNDSITTKYLCPEVPGHIVETVQKLFQLQHGQRKPAPYQIVHQKLIELKIPE